MLTLVDGTDNENTDHDLIREQKQEEMMSVANCGMQDEKDHENEAGGNIEKKSHTSEFPQQDHS